MLKQIITDRLEQVPFSRKFDENEIALLLKEIDTRSAILETLPVLPYAYGFLTETFNKSVYSSLTVEKERMKSEAALNLLTILENSIHKPAEEKALENLRVAYKLIGSVPASGEPFALTVDFIKRMHMHITFDIRAEGNIPGSFRNRPADIRYFAPPSTNISRIMERFTDWFQSDEIRSLHPLARAVLAHYHVNLIHPFGDANGRTARCMEAAIIKKAGYSYLWRSLAVYYKKNRSDYYKNFRKSQKTGGFDITPFMRFALKGMAKTTTMLTDILIAGMRISALKDFFSYLKSEGKINGRQFRLLSIMLDQNRSFSEEELLKNPVFSHLYEDEESEASTDLTKLADTGIILRSDGEFKLNSSLPGI
jgi:Fic family protein